ncbi:MAG: methylated-DNA--[protein]-cysteine S-methyltransferase [Bacteroidales bacterium]|nr:methylated-DNA--[protein]-cysteine S-methyltransferase [Bacteroidales bacterium]
MEVNVYNSPLGDIWYATEGDALAGLWFEGQKHFPPWLERNAASDAISGPMIGPMTGASGKVARWLQRFFEGSNPSLDFSLSPQGTPFQKKVWAKLLEIPYGETVTYGELARLLDGEAKSGLAVRAVAGAVGRNPISIIIPCHRVLGAGGRLTGYAAGLQRKAALLGIEGCSI